MLYNTVATRHTKPLNTWKAVDPNWDVMLQRVKDVDLRPYKQLYPRTLFTEKTIQIMQTFWHQFLLSSKPMGPFHSLDIYWADAIQLRKRKVEKESRWERKCHEILNRINQSTMCYATRKIKKKKEKKRKKPFWKWRVRSWIKSGIFLGRIWLSKKYPLQECLVYYLVDLGRQLGDRGCWRKRTLPGGGSA